MPHPLQERLLEFAQSEAECARPAALLSREAGAVEAAARDARQRDTRRAQLDVASDALRQATAALSPHVASLQPDASRLQPCVHSLQPDVSSVQPCVSGQAMVPLDAQGDTLTLHGEVYVERMWCGHRMPSQLHGVAASISSTHTHRSH